MEENKEPKKKLGRPKKLQEFARSPGVSVRLSKVEKDAINAAIKRSGLKSSEWLRKSLIYCAQHDIRIT